MSRDGPDYSSPFLGAHPSDTDLEETKFYADGPGIYPGEFGHGQIRPQRPRDASIPAALVKLKCRRKFLSWTKFWGWPTVVISGQLLLQIIAWGFFTAVQSQGSIALPPPLAASAKANPHIVGWISTQISTIFAFLSTL
jgi:hypothetical protein